MKIRVKKICEGLREKIYKCKEEKDDSREMEMGVMKSMEELNNVMGKKKENRNRVIVDDEKKIKNWFVKVRKIKEIYNKMKMLKMDVKKKCMIEEWWVKVMELEKIKMDIRRGNERSGRYVKKILKRME